MKSVCFTGHRNLSFDIELEKRLEKEIRSLAEGGAEEFYCGGAVGWDTYCTETVLRVRESMPQIRLMLVLLCNEKQQTLKWSNIEKRSLGRYGKRRIILNIPLGIIQRIV